MSAKTPLLKRSGARWCRKCRGDMEHLDGRCLTCNPWHAYGLKMVPAHLLPYLPGGV